MCMQDLRIEGKARFAPHELRGGVSAEGMGCVSRQWARGAAGGSAHRWGPHRCCPGGGRCAGRSAAAPAPRKRALPSQEMSNSIVLHAAFSAGQTCSQRHQCTAAEDFTVALCGAAAAMQQHQQTETGACCRGSSQNWHLQEVRLRRAPRNQARFDAGRLQAGHIGDFYAGQVLHCEHARAAVAPVHNRRAHPGHAPEVAREPACKIAPHSMSTLKPATAMLEPAPSACDISPKGMGQLVPRKQPQQLRLVKYCTACVSTASMRSAPAHAASTCQHLLALRPSAM